LSLDRVQHGRVSSKQGTRANTRQGQRGAEPSPDHADPGRGIKKNLKAEKERSSRDEIQIRFIAFQDQILDRGQGHRLKTTLNTNNAGNSGLRWKKVEIADVAAEIMREDSSLLGDLRKSVLLTAEEFYGLTEAQKAAVAKEFLEKLMRMLSLTTPRSRSSSL